MQESMNQLGKQELIQKIKHMELEKAENSRITQQAKQQLENLHQLIDKKVQHYKQDDSQSTNSSQRDVNELVQNNTDGETYWQRLKNVVGHIQFLDSYVMKCLSHQLTGQMRIVTLIYYIDWGYAVKYGGEMVKHVRSLWEDVKWLITKISTYLKQAAQWIWEKIKGAFQWILGY